ncbi:immunity 49 family protein [Streptomyces sp. NPDC101112]|uniref:immunity 49 family protein n=1 Tax=Streptomyces sp. NPDC101112 TaxID=3366105 RepID=UPI00382B59CA
MREVSCHEVAEDGVARALDDIAGRTGRRCGMLRYDDASPERLGELRDELLDHIAARRVAGLAPDESSRAALRTAAECSLGILSTGCFPKGDQEIFIPLVGETLSSDDTAFGAFVDRAPTARAWLDAFELCVVSGLVWEWRRVIGLLLRTDYASEIRKGVPYSPLESVSDPADLATMDALCGYLTHTEGHLPRDWPTVPLCEPDAGERAEAARRLDAVDGPLTPDQRLLRVLLDDDRPAFEQALADRLDKHRAEVGAAPAPRTLLPLGPLALAAIAVQVHGWKLDVRSGYLPPDLLGSPRAPREAADPDENDLGQWTAR